MTRLIYLPDDATIIQLEVDIAPAELVAAVNAGLKPLPILRSAQGGVFTAVRIHTTVIIAPAPGAEDRAPPRISPISPAASARCWNLTRAVSRALRSQPCSTFPAARSTIISTRCAAGCEANLAPA